MARILVVDDQPCVGELLSEELGKEGYDVTGVEDGESIWGQLGTLRPDVVLLDLYLDGFEGWDVLRQIKRVEPDLPVLIFTAYDSFKKDPRLSQADGYLVKSFTALDELKQKIAELLSWKRTTHAEKDASP